MDNVKIYGLCMERLKFQIENAKGRLAQGALVSSEQILLESYNTADPEDIIDILELYDIDRRTFEAVREKLDELSFTVSVLTRETLGFGMTEKGHLGLYLAVTANLPNGSKIEEAAVA